MFLLKGTVVMKLLSLTWSAPLTHPCCDLLAAHGDRRLRPSSTRAAQEEVTAEAWRNLQGAAKGSRSEVRVNVDVFLRIDRRLCERRECGYNIHAQRMRAYNVASVCARASVWTVYSALSSAGNQFLLKVTFPSSSLVTLPLPLSAVRPWGRWKMFMRKILRWGTPLVWHLKSTRRRKI